MGYIMILEKLKKMQKKLGRYNNRKNCINDIQTEIGIESKEYHLTSKDAANIRWNGSYFVESMDDGYNGVAIKCVKGATYTPLNERVTYYVFDYEPKVGEENDLSK